MVSKKRIQKIIKNNGKIPKQVDKFIQKSIKELNREFEQENERVRRSLL